jgi:hypothetical protein
MADSRELAKLIGPTLTVMSVSEMINFHIWKINIPPNTYLNGILLFVTGLSIARVHNYWRRSWITIVTLVGWLSVVSGLFRIFFPEAKQAPDSVASFIGISILLGIGLFLKFKGYTLHDLKKKTT